VAFGHQTIKMVPATCAEGEWPALRHDERTKRHGSSATAVLTNWASIALVAGETDVQILAELAQGRLRSKRTLLE
jgi:hypothetical protein